MDEGDDAVASETSDDSIVPPGPRRSTYVPPTDTTPNPALFSDVRAPAPSPMPSPGQEEPEPVDDDAFLSAFEAETAQILTTPIVTIGTTRPSSELSDLPAPTGPPVALPQPEPQGAPVATDEPESWIPAATGRHSLETTPIEIVHPPAPVIPRDWEPEITSGIAPATELDGIPEELPPPSAGVEPFAAPPPVVYDLVEPPRSTTPALDLVAITPLAPPPPLGVEGAPFAPPSPAVPQRDEPAPSAEPVAGELPEPAQPETPAQSDTRSSPPQPTVIPLVPEGAVALVDETPTAPSPWQVETAGLEPTPTDRRVGRAARLFWLWFATNASVLSVAFGAAILSLGMSLRQAAISVFLGIVFSFVPLGLSTLAGKWSGQPTMVTSRAAFGLVGNVVPAALAVVTRVFWGAVLLWLLGISTAHIVVQAGLGGPLDETQLTAAVMVIAFLIAVVIAVLGYGLFARVQLAITAVTAALVIGFIAITWRGVDLTTALTVADGPWLLIITGIVLVFSFVGLVWANSGSDLARYQNPAGSGAAAMLWGPLGTVLGPLVLIIYGALLAASNPVVGVGLVTDPLGTIAGMLPDWYPVPLIAATALSLLSGVVLTIYSGAFALQSVGLSVHRAVASIIVAVLVLALAIFFSVTSLQVTAVFRDLATTLAVPVAAWAGIMTAEMIVRQRRFEAGSLLRRGGVYPDVNPVNLGGLLIASGVGLGLTSATIGWLNWQGYLFRLFGVDLHGTLAGTDLGVLVALLLGLLTPFILGVRTVRAQERVRLVAE